MQTRSLFVAAGTLNMLPLAQSPYLPLGVGEILDFERLCIHFLQGTCPIANTGGPSTKKYYPVLGTHNTIKSRILYGDIKDHAERTLQIYLGTAFGCTLTL